MSQLIQKEKIMNNYISVEKEFHMSCVQMLKNLGYYYDGKEWVTLQEHCCDKQPTPCEESIRGFEDLVYVEPEDFSYIVKKTLTPAQNEFLTEVFNVSCCETNLPLFYFNGWCWEEEKYKMMAGGKEVSFNTIYKYKENV